MSVDIKVSVFKDNVEIISTPTSNVINVVNKPKYTGPIEIPKLKVNVINGIPSVAVDFYQSNDWKSHAPQIALFTTSHKKRHKSISIIHPNDKYNRLSNGKFWGGSSKFSREPLFGSSEISHVSVFDMQKSNPYLWFGLQSFYDDRWSWLKLRAEDKECMASEEHFDKYPPRLNQLGSDRSELNYFYQFLGSQIFYEDWESINPYTPQSIKKSKYKRIFKFAIVIKNPENDPSNPWIFGPMSDVITLHPCKMANGTFDLVFGNGNPKKILFRSNNNKYNFDIRKGGKKDAK